jgi:hypothetical protein
MKGGWGWFEEWDNKIVAFIILDKAQEENCFQVLTDVW